MKSTFSKTLCTLLLSVSPYALFAEDSTPLPDPENAPKVTAVDFEDELPTEETHAKAMVRAAAEKRLVVTIFASSASPHCNAFQKGVLTTPEFRAFAKDKVVLVVFDITTYGARTSFECDMIEALKERYRVEGTPHITVESPSEKILLDTEGYAGTPTAKIVADLEGLWNGVFSS